MSSDPTQSFEPFGQDSKTDLAQELECDLESNQLTQILEEVRSGDRNAANQLFEIVYKELKQLAHRALRNESPNQTLQVTALVHEAWIRLIGTQRRTEWNNRGHFFSAASEAIRRILVDAARARLRFKRGAGADKKPLMEEDAVWTEDETLVALNQAIDDLRELDPNKAELVIMRYFGGFTIHQTAEKLGISTATVERNWRFARAWLRSKIDEAS